MRTTSANGPNNSMPMGIMALPTIPITPKTRPRNSGSTCSCNNTVDGVLNSGMANPQTPITPKYAQNQGNTPMPKVVMPNKEVASAMVQTRFLNPPHEAMAIPPIDMPRKNAISMALRRQTSVPKLRATCSGVKNAAGAAMNMKTAQ